MSRRRNMWLEEFCRKQRVTVIPSGHITATGSFVLRVGSRTKAPHSQCRNYHVLDRDALGHAELRLFLEWCKATSSKKRLSSSGRRQRGLCLPTRFLGHRERVGEDEAICGFLLGSHSFAPSSQFFLRTHPATRPGLLLPYSQTNWASLSILPQLPRRQGWQCCDG